MTTEERVGEIIEQTALQIGIPRQAASALGSMSVLAILGEGLAIREPARSRELSTRFHAHCDFVSRHSGEGKDEIYSQVLHESVRRGLYPYVLVTQRVTIRSAAFDVDVQVPVSTTSASNRELLAAYGVLEEFAAARQIALPERRGYGGH